MKKFHFRSKRAGVSLAEVIVASAMSSFILLFAISVFLMCTSSWVRGENMMDSDNQVRSAVRLISDELREAMWVSVDADGKGLTYRKPKKDVNGNFQIPVLWDGLDRRFEFESGRLYMKPTSTTKKLICRNVMTTDPFVGIGNAFVAKKQIVSGPLPSYPAYRFFQANVGAIVSEVTVTIVASNNGGRAGEVTRSRRREVVALRNVPELIK